MKIVQGQRIKQRPGQIVSSRIQEWHGITYHQGHLIMQAEHLVVHFQYPAHEE